ncbi:MAG TPA: hypothetical protein DEQ03_19395 [Marinilabiliales bacterium]|nr:hypothetical protein [Marinilabiliales bacterium]
MKKLSDTQKANLKLAAELLCEDSTALVKVEKALSLVKGISPKAEKYLSSSIEIIAKINKISEGAVVELSAQNLPEQTKTQKHRKKLILLLITNLKDFKSEISRLQALQTTSAVGTTKILATLKGPLGLVTVVAAVVVVGVKLIDTKTTSITISNFGCRPIPPLTEKSISLPGLKLPDSTIASGGSDTLSIPTLPLSVSLSPGSVTLSSIGLNRQFSIPLEYKDVVFDGQSLMNRQTDLKLSSSKTHRLELRCQ